MRVGGGTASPRSHLPSSEGRTPTSSARWATLIPSASRRRRTAAPTPRTSRPTPTAMGSSYPPRTTLGSGRDRRWSPRPTAVGLPTEASERPVGSPVFKTGGGSLAARGVRLLAPPLQELQIADSRQQTAAVLPSAICNLPPQGPGCVGSPPPR